MNNPVKVSFVTVLATALFGLASIAHGAMITLTDAQLDAFTNVGPNTNLSSWSVLGFPPRGNHVAANFYSACGNDVTIGTCEATFGLTGQSIAFGPTDTFGLVIYNSNASPWEFTLTIIDTLNNQLTTSTIVAGTQQMMSIASNGTVDPIQTILLSVRDGVAMNGLNNDDAIANFNMKPLPEPGSLGLLGLALAGLGLTRRRRLRD